MTYRQALKVFAADVADRPVRNTTRQRAAKRCYKGNAATRRQLWSDSVRIVRNETW